METDRRADAEELDGEWVPPASEEWETEEERLALFGGGSGIAGGENLHEVPGNART